MDEQSSTQFSQLCGRQMGAQGSRRIARTRGARLDDHRMRGLVIDVGGTSECAGQRQYGGSVTPEKAALINAAGLHADSPDWD